MYPYPEIFQACLEHRALHQCGSYPYGSGDVLSLLSKTLSAKKILEVGTGLGYSTLCLLSQNQKVSVITIDQDESHVAIAKKYWQENQVLDRITSYVEKAEDVLVRLDEQFDLIFFDGYVPQMKMLLKFEKLTRKDGLLVTANLFLRDDKGGRYLNRLQDKRYWETGVFSDTAISVRSSHRT